MNPQSSNGWPPGAVPGPAPPGSEMHPQIQQRQLGSYGANLQHSALNQMATPVLPPPGPMYNGQGNGPGLHALAGLNQSPSQSRRTPPSQQQPSPSIAAHHQSQHLPPQQGPGYSLPGINHAIQQSPPSTAGVDREREYRMQEMREIEERRQQEMMREQERERDLREIHENHAGSIPLQQPVASRIPATLHGPNGILSSNPNVGLNTPSGPLGAPSGPGNVFANNPQANHEAGRILVGHPSQSLHPQQLLGLSNQISPQHLQTSAAAIAQGQQPILNDALLYLDQVKVRFVDHPHVYNRFLDIMKDFKSQAIDTPGVIERVSTLFNGHPELIQGFNTFLPPGYRIECGTRDDPNSIRVTTPMGTTVSQMSSIPNHMNGILGSVIDTSRRSPIPFADPYRNEGHWPLNQVEPQEEQYSPNVGPRSVNAYPEQAGARPTHDGYYNREEEANAAEAAALAHQQEQQGVSHLQNALNAAANNNPARSMIQSSPNGEPATLGQAVVGLNNGPNGVQLAGQLGMEKRGPVEFNQAIHYVNKIKNRFSTQPEIYKQFLEILQTYQRESKPIQDVYAQVTQLFNAAPDLLEDFKQFLPESAAQAKAQAAAQQQKAEDAVMLSNVRGDPTYLVGAQVQAQTPRPDTKMPPIGNFAPPSSISKESKKRRGGAGSQMTGSVAAPATVDAGPLGGQGNRLGSISAANPNKRMKLQPTKDVPPPPVISPTLIPDLPHPMPPSASNGGTSEEIAFFDRVRKFIANKQTFNEFLKLCNLFSQDLIDKETLVHKAANFFGGNPDLMGWFRGFVLYSGRDEVIENKAMQSDAKVVLSNCRALGPSYRLLPKRERLKPCSGRDEMCQSVLNDEWASHPTWASEDSGFIAHRKNMYEEALHRMEEERHDYDFNIETCLRTIQLLEPIVQQMSSMTEEEKRMYRLPHGIGGQSEAIYQRIIKKIYDRTKGSLVIEDMFARPYAVCHIVLHRLRQKVEEWKAGQREWEKVWREQTYKQFWKSLDHQGLSAKNENKRQFQPKSLQADIHTKYEEQKRQRIIKWASVPKWQFEYEFKDNDVVMDACHIILTYLHNAHTGNNGDETKIQTFLKSFIPAFFDLDRDMYQRKIADIYDITPSNEEADEEVPNADDSTVHRGRKAVNGKKDDLRRGVLQRHQNGKPKKEPFSDSKESTPDVTSMDEDSTTTVDTPNEQAMRLDVMENRWMDHPPSARRQEHKHNEPFPRDSFSLYANVSIYCFMRMFQMLYERLLRVKENEKQVHEAVRRSKAHKPAMELRTADKGADEFFHDIGPNANYYEQIKKMMQEIIKGEDDMIHLEETLRRFYLQSGWQLYSYDKMLAAIVRFALACTINDTKDKSSDIINLFYKNRKESTTTHQAEIDYRKQVEKLAKESDIFRIVWHKPTQKATIQIFKRDDKTFDPDEMSAADTWSYYVASYVMRDPTEGVTPEIQYPILRRNLPANHLTEDELNAQFLPQWNEDGLVIRICPNNYHLLYDSGTQDWWIHDEKVRAKGMKGMNEATEERTTKFQDKFGEGAAWRIAMEEKELERVESDFRRLLSDGTVPDGEVITVKKDIDEVMTG